MRTGKIEKTVIIVTTFQEFYTYRYYSVFIEHFEMDSEKGIGHNPFLYMIWNEKFHFMRRAIELDPFRSNYFMWVDIGCFRVPNTRFIHWPKPQRISTLDKSKVLVLSVVPFTKQEWSCHSLKTLPSFNIVIELVREFLVVEKRLC